MGSGKGIPSISCQRVGTHPRFCCTKLIRVGTCAAARINLYDVVIAQERAGTNSNFVGSAAEYPGTYAPIGSYRLIELSCENARKREVHPRG